MDISTIEEKLVEFGLSKDQVSTISDMIDDYGFDQREEGSYTEMYSHECDHSFCNEE